MRVEQAILSNLITNEDYCRKVAPHLKTEYFSDRTEAAVASLILSFFVKYNKTPSVESISVEIDSLTGYSEKEIKETQEYVKGLVSKEKNEAWLIEQTENFCKDRAVYNAIIDSIKIIDGRDKKHSKDAIPTILSEALSVCFDNHIGHDYIDDYSARYDFYHRVEEKIPFDLELFNEITGGGLSRKTLNVILAGCVHPETSIRVRYRKVNPK